jgi:methylglutaconyl-CoA hydratase
VTDQPLVLSDGATPVTTLTLNEPEARNPLSPGLVRQLTELLRALERDDAVRSVVIVGAGKGFSAGADLRRMRAADPLEDRDEYNSILELNRTLWNFAKPTIAAVHGFAMGAGANLMSWCDIAVAEEGTRIGYPEVKAGVPSATVIPTLLRTMSRKRLYDLVLTGRTLEVAEAAVIGLVSRAVPAGQAYVQALEIAGVIAGHHPAAVRLTKEIVHATTDMTYEQGIEHAKEVRVIARLRKDFQVEIRQGGRGVGARSAS